MSEVRVALAGEELARARGAVVLIHGRGASADDILGLAGELDTGGLALVAPQAPGGAWYPYGFMQPIERNEPWLSAALGTVGALVAQLGEAGIGPERIVLLGFSQGACLVTEWVARNARRYGGVVALSGGLIGPDGTPRDYQGSLDGTPVFLGCSDVDFHIPQERVTESATVLGALGAAVDMRLYPGMGHTVNEDELAAAQAILDAVRGDK
jgi:predicted esterase